MAVTAKFQADFSDFSDGVQKAEKDLKGLEQEADKAQTSINKVGGTGGQFGTVTAQATESTKAFGGLRGVLNDVAESAGLTFAALGTLGTVAVVAATAIGSFKLTSKIVEWTGFNKVVGDLTASFLGLDAILKEQVAEANATALAAEQQRLINIVAQAPKILALQRAEIERLGPANQQLAVDIGSHTYSLEQLSAKYKVSVGAIKVFTEELQNEAAVQKEVAAFELSSTLANEAARKASQKEFEDIAHRRQTQIDAEIKQNLDYTVTLQKVDAQIRNTWVAAEVAAQAELEKTSSALDDQTSAIDRLLQKQSALFQLESTTGVSTKAQQAVLQKEIAKTLLDDATAAEEATAKTRDLNSETANVPAVFGAATQAVSSFAQGLAAVPAATQGVFRDIFGQVTAGQGAITIAHSSITPRAGGGAVSSGTPYMVGERGPELFVPGSSGSISSNGGMNVTITINGSVLGNKQEIAQAVSAALTQHLKNSGQRFH